ncbi:MAG TPA: type I-D CRISPR-associated protein Csc2 [Bacilli bacterium]|nr:type I-D CRISPR-associated protein Csc2 [Bacilli bacterium]
MSMDQLRSYLNDTQKVLVPEEVKKQKSLPPVMNRNVVTIVGLKTTAGRFLPVSHEGYSNETYVDKVKLLGKDRAEFIARKLKGIERRAHMSLFRGLAEKKLETEWHEAFKTLFDKTCTIPGGLCVTCWNCSLFGALEAGKGGTFARIRYFDTWSYEDAQDCIASLQSDEGMGIGNTVNEDLREERGSDSYHLYEYVKAGTHFPFITVIESPTALDVAGYIQAVRMADLHGYGKYNANHGKFDTKFLAVAPGMPRFSILSMLEKGSAESIEQDFENGTFRFDAPEGSVVQGHDAVLQLGDVLQEEFAQYVSLMQSKE